MNLCPCTPRGNGVCVALVRSAKGSKCGGSVARLRKEFTVPKPFNRKPEFKNVFAVNHGKPLSIAKPLHLNGYRK